MKPYLLALLLFSGEEVVFVTSEVLCFETLRLHQEGSLVIAKDVDGKEWPVERVLCLEPISEDKDAPIS